MSHNIHEAIKAVMRAATVQHFSTPEVRLTLPDLQNVALDGEYVRFDWQYTTRKGYRCSGDALVSFQCNDGKVAVHHTAWIAEEYEPIAFLPLDYGPVVAMVLDSIVQKCCWLQHALRNPKKGMVEYDLFDLFDVE